MMYLGWVGFLPGRDLILLEPGPPIPRPVFCVPNNCRLTGPALYVSTLPLSSLQDDVFELWKDTERHVNVVFSAGYEENYFVR